MSSPYFCYEERSKNQEERSKNQEERSKNQEERSKNQEERSKNQLKRGCEETNDFSQPLLLFMKLFFVKNSVLLFQSLHRQRYALLVRVSRQDLDLNDVADTHHVERMFDE